MKNSYKAALLAALVLTVVSQAHADLLLGFTDTSASTPKDYVIDIGSYTAFTSSASLSGTISAANGASGSAASIYSPLDGSYLNDVSVGAYFASTSAGTGHGATYQTGTFFSPLTPADVANSDSLYNNVFAALGLNPSGSTGWSGYVAQSATMDGAATTGSVSIDTGNPMSQVNGGIATMTLSDAIINVSGRNQTVSENTLGTLTVNLNNDTWTFNGAAVSVPEPSTYGLLAGAGLLVVGLRRQFVKKSA